MGATFSCVGALCCSKAAPDPIVNPTTPPQGCLFHVSTPTAMQSDADLDAMDLKERNDPALHAKLASSASSAPSAPTDASPSFASSFTAAGVLESSPEPDPRPTSSVYSQEGICR